MTKTALLATLLVFLASRCFACTFDGATGTCTEALIFSSITQSPLHDPTTKDLEDILQDYLTGDDPDTLAVYITWWRTSASM